jgi:pimeloyl-ACP methyl ester carboxylesterase
MSSLPAYRLHGEAGPWLVLIHGAFGSMDDFAGVISLLARHYHVLCWDLPGHGASIDQRPLGSLKEAASALRDLMDLLSIEHASVLGCSFGGMAAQRFAADHPSRCEALLACVCVPIFDTPLPSPGLLMALTRLGWWTKSWPRWCASFAKQATSDAAAQERLAAQVGAHSPALRQAIWSAMLHGCRNESGGRFEMPVGLLTAERDTRFPGAMAGYKRFAARLPADRHLELAAANHMAYVEQPAIFAEGALSLLERLRSRAPEA